MLQRLSHPYLLLSLCALFWSGNFVLSRAMRGEIPPLGLAFWRWALALLIVLPWLIGPLRANWPLIRRHLGRMTLLGLLGAASFNTFIYLGVQHTTATNSVLLQSTMPLVIVLLNWAIYRESISGRTWASIAISLIGVAVIIGKGNPLSLLGGAWNQGDLLIMVAVLVWALYSLFLHWRPKDLDPTAFLGFSFIVAVISLLPLYLWETASGSAVIFNTPTLITFAYVAIFPSVLAYLFWNRGVASVGAVTAGYFVHLMPVFGSILAIVFLGERFGGHHLIGASLIAVAIWMTTRKGKTAKAH